MLPARSHTISGYASQRGVALIVGLILLLVLTMIGVIAIKSSTQQERMAAGYQQQAQTFQAAESAIRLVTGQLLERRGNPLNRNADFLSNASVALTPATATPPLAPAGVVSITGNIAGFNTAVNLYQTAQPAGFRVTGQSERVNADGTTSGAIFYDLNAVATQPNTGARSNNILGIWRPVPAGSGE